MMKERRKVWRQEAGSIISQKKHERDLLYEKPANSDLHKKMDEYGIPLDGL